MVDERMLSFVKEFVESRDPIHHGNPPTLEAKIESDADLLDENGALTVLWDTLAVGAQEEQSYQIVYERLRAHWRPGEIAPTDQFHTGTAKQFFRDRKSFFNRFMENLELELGLCDEAQP